MRHSTVAQPTAGLNRSPPCRRVLQSNLSVLLPSTVTGSSHVCAETVTVANGGKSGRTIGFCKKRCLWNITRDQVVTGSKTKTGPTSPFKIVQLGSIYNCAKRYPVIKKVQ